MNTLARYDDILLATVNIVNQGSLVKKMKMLNRMTQNLIVDNNKAVIFDDNKEVVFRELRPIMKKMQMRNLVTKDLINDVLIGVVISEIRLIVEVSFGVKGKHQIA